MNWIAKQDARHRLVFSLFAAAVVWFILRGRVAPSTQSILTWDVFALSVLSLAWLTIMTTPLEKLRSRAQMQDVSRTVIFIFVVLAACAGLFAVGFLFFANKALRVPLFFFLFLLTLLPLFFSWLLVL